ncbi:GNAT family N-acetyltransferase [Pseudoflavitalea sp. G-6-1-2]|uniref:GNAT family N-acetyltransferase n=1 Tax=Pseudoflavitalea sp. G-6-1-2 TaxID=2728841 RepID=UPI00146DFA94|nr:GNAT family N-acetyltransferase [Pseudoflavitalea sp. G-6-1-2]NML20290.1 GNAT family N-acetyltransferase [Pseudoflavitalea sp. G-6-1-2]
MPLNIRSVNPEDVQIIYTFICDLEETTFDYERFKQLYLQNIAEENHIYLVAEENSKVIGYLSCHGQNLLHHLGMVFEIQEMFVDAGQRGKGIGRKLVSELENRLRDRECCGVEVSSNATRTATHEFYVSCGFKKSHFKFTKAY